MRKTKTNRRFFIFFLCSSLLITTLTIIALVEIHNIYNISPEIKKLHSLQNMSAQIKRDIFDLGERIKTFNNEVEVVLNSREKFPAGEFIPEKINPHKIFTNTGKETP